MYTIKGKDYSEFDINKRCAELMGFKVKQRSMVDEGNVFVIDMSDHLGEMYRRIPQYCNNPSDTWPIIEKCWDELNLKFITKITHVNSNTTVYKALNREWVDSKWQHIIKKHKCTKLVAACICFIELN